MPLPPEELMRLAVEKCREGIAIGQSPFGCAIAIGDDVVSVSHNQVLLQTDITAHAEIVALREACQRRGDIFLEHAAVATTCEPCPMCMSALHWARVETVYFGATIEDAKSSGFSELTIPAEQLVRQGGGSVRLVPQVLAKECRELFDQWRANPSRRAY